MTLAAPTPADPTPEETKACCAAAYSSDAVAMLLGDSYHPGGLALTRHLADQLRLTPGARVLDVATGPGRSALMFAQEHDSNVCGIDLSPGNVASARAAAAAAGLEERVEFTVADAERLPYNAQSFDAVVCECALCTFPDKAAAAAELARVLRPGGRVAISDVTADPAGLPDELCSLAARVACVADARPLADYARILVDAGLEVVLTERHDDAMSRMLEQIEARLNVARMIARPRAEEVGIDFDRVGPVLDAARAAVDRGVLGYGLVVAARPAGGARAGRIAGGRA